MGAFLRFISGQANVCYRVVLATGKVWDVAAGEFSSETAFGDSLIEATKTAVTNAHAVVLPASARIGMEGMVEIFYSPKASVVTTTIPAANPMFKITNDGAILHGIQ